MPASPPFINSACLLRDRRSLIGQINEKGPLDSPGKPVSLMEQNVLTFYRGIVFQTWIGESVSGQLLMHLLPRKAAALLPFSMFIGSSIG